MTERTYTLRTDLTCICGGYYSHAAELGRGAYGAVYRGADEDGQIVVAIKRIEGLLGDQAWERIREREVQVGYQIKSAGNQIRHLVRPIDVGRSGTDLFIVMPHAERSLKMRCAKDCSTIRHA